MRWISTVAVFNLGVGIAQAGNVGVEATKLIVVDKLARASKAKTVFVAKDAAITKGAGLGQGDIEVRFEAGYDGTPTLGSFDLPLADSGWLVNKETVAKFVNKDAPGGSTEAKVAVIKPGKLLKIVAKGLGDKNFDILAAGPPPGVVRSKYCVTNAGVDYCHCSQFSGCVWKSIAGGTGAKLVCKGGIADPSCTDPCAGAPGRYVSSNLTVLDTCRGLEWVKQLDCGAPVECTDDPGFCSLPLCLQHYNWSDGGGAANGNAFTLYLAQLNGTVPALLPLEGGGLTAFTTSCYAGHCDWRLPEIEELQSIVDGSFCFLGGVPNPCLDSAFWPAERGYYWSSTSDVVYPDLAMNVNFADGTVHEWGKTLFFGVRAVRDAQ